MRLGWRAEAVWGRTPQSYSLELFGLGGYSKTQSESVSLVANALASRLEGFSNGMVPVVKRERNKPNQVHATCIKMCASSMFVCASHRYS